MTDTAHALVWDAGGSKTDILIINTAGEVRAYARGGPANVNFVPRAQVEASLTAAIRDALHEAAIAPADIAAGCMAGPMMFEVAQQICHQTGIDVALRVIHEGEAALWATQPWHDGFIAVAVGAGTGSIIFGRHPDGRRVSVGGWGSLIGDEGSAWWLGLRGLNAVTRALDGRDPPGLMTSALLDALGVAPDDADAFIRRVYQPTMQRHEIAALAPVVAQAATQGDPVACRIVADAGHDLAEHANAAIRRLGMTGDRLTVLGFGSVFKAGEPLLATFRSTVLACAPHAQFAAVRFPPVIGCAVAALQSLGVELTPDILAHLAAGAARVQR